MKVNIHQRLAVATFGIGFAILGVCTVPARAALLDFKFDGSGYAGPNKEYDFNGSFTLDTLIVGTLVMPGGQGEPEEFNYPGAISDYSLSVVRRVSIPNGPILDAFNYSVLSLPAVSDVSPDFTLLSAVNTYLFAPHPVSAVTLGFPPGVIDPSLPSDPMVYTSSFLYSNSAAYGGPNGGFGNLGNLYSLTVTPHVTSPPTSVPEPVSTWALSVLGLFGLLKRLLQPKLDGRGFPCAAIKG